MPPRKDPAVMPANRRRVNPVDRYRDCIHELQEFCEHDFRLLEPACQERSPADDRVFILGCLGRPHRASVRCLHCSAEKTVEFSETCPHCLGMLTEASEPIRERRQFYGDEYPYFTHVRFLRCWDCGDVFVMDVMQ